VDAQEDWRFYHSTALLLPDARVVSFGGNPAQRVYEDSIEVYTPPYLYTSSGTLAERPAVTGVPAQIGYDAGFEVAMPAPGAIAQAVLMRPGAATHAFDMEQRLVELVIQGATGDRLRLAGPPNANIAPPGYYMLFLIDASGVPSEASFLRLGADVVVAPPPSPSPSPSPSPPPPARSGPVPSCAREPATVFVRDGVIVGGPGDGLSYAGHLRGTPGPDVMVGTDGDDVLEGLGGGDRICGGRGNDRLKGDSGSDTLLGEGGQDRLAGGAGADRCYGGPGPDRASGCEGRVKR
jgi:hypothetical protein